MLYKSIHIPVWSLHVVLLVAHSHASPQTVQKSPSCPKHAKHARTEHKRSSNCSCSTSQFIFHFGVCKLSSRKCHNVTFLLQTRGAVEPKIEGRSSHYRNKSIHVPVSSQQVVVFPRSLTVTQVCKLSQRHLLATNTCPNAVEEKRDGMSSNYSNKPIHIQVWNLQVVFPGRSQSHNTSLATCPTKTFLSPNTRSTYVPTEEKGGEEKGGEEERAREEKRRGLGEEDLGEESGDNARNAIFAWAIKETTTKGTFSVTTCRVSSQNNHPPKAD